MLSTVKRSKLSNWSKTHLIHTHTLTQTEKVLTPHQTMLKETANSCLSSNIVGSGAENRKAPETAGCLSPAHEQPQKLCNFCLMNICLFSYFVFVSPVCVFVFVFAFVFTCGSLHQSFYSSSLCQFSP